MTQHCGTIALLGRPNAGKSTLLNAFVGQKVAGVSKKPQTTRNRILGIVTEDDCQFLFLDTPGLHNAKGLKRLNQMIVREALASLQEANIVLYLVDAETGITNHDLALLKQIHERYQGKLEVVISKCDKLHKSKISAVVAATKEALKDEGLTFAVNTISAKRRESLSTTKSRIKREMPEGGFMFPPDDLTDRPTRFVVGELIREGIFRCTGQELPYDTAVVVQSFDPGPTTLIQADIIVSRQTQKGIMIGKQGSKLKEIGTSARQSIEQFLGNKVFLELNVCVRERWVDDSQSIAELLDLQN